MLLHKEKETPDSERLNTGHDYDEEPGTTPLRCGRLTKEARSSSDDDGDSASKHNSQADKGGEPEPVLGTPGR